MITLLFLVFSFLFSDSSFAKGGGYAVAKVDCAQLLNRPIDSTNALNPILYIPYFETDPYSLPASDYLANAKKPSSRCVDVAHLACGFYEKYSGDFRLIALAIQNQEKLPDGYEAFRYHHSLTCSAFPKERQWNPKTLGLPYNAAQWSSPTLPTLN